MIEKDEGVCCLDTPFCGHHRAVIAVPMRSPSFTRLEKGPVEFSIETGHLRANVLKSKTRAKPRFPPHAHVLSRLTELAETNKLTQPARD